MALGELASLGVVLPNIALPHVAIIRKSIKTSSEAEKLIDNSNVIIATASILKTSNQKAIEKLCKGCTDLFVDEAHHVAASSWSEVKNKFEGKRVVQFTATPFRNSGDPLGGSIIFNYTIGEAQKGGFFKHINLIPVEEYYDDKRDKAIAKRAVDALRKDIESGYDHVLMARVETKTRADEIFPIYQTIAPELKPVIIHSGHNQSEVRSALNALLSRQSRIVVCVKMLGEGFDFPNLKIAAIHDIHKSLAITLQFIGRFVRKTKNVHDASVIVNVADPEVEEGLEKLYSQGAQWDNVLQRLSENRIEREIRLQEVVERLKEKGNLHNQLSLWNLRPSFSAMIFKTGCSDWFPENFKTLFTKSINNWFAISSAESLLVVLALENSPVKWGNYKNLNDSIYKLLIAHWDSKRSALLIYSNDYDWFRTVELAKLLTNNSAELLSGPQVFNVLNKIEYPLVRNLGAAKIGAISFTQYFGPNVTEGLSDIEASESSLSNLAALGYEEGNRVLWGCSQKKGKVWSVQSGSITEWCEWVKKAWDKIIDGEIDESNITRGFLRPKKITQPYTEHPLSIQWGEYTLSESEDKIHVLFGDTDIPLYLVELKILGQEQDGSYMISVNSDNIESIYRFKIDGTLPGGFEYGLLQGNPISIKRGEGVPRKIEEYLVIDPWIIRYIDGSYSYNSYLIKVSQKIGQYNSDEIEVWDWGNVDITKESMGPSKIPNTIQYKAYKEIEDQYDVILNDDGKSEAADLIGLKIVGDFVLLGLIHCKYSSSSIPGKRIDDLYEVCGQAQKSIHWKHSGIVRLASHIKKRDELWKQNGNTRFLKGTMSDLISIRNRSRTAGIKFQVVIVQPGLQKSAVTEEMLRVLGSTDLFLRKTSEGQLSVIGSP